MIGKPAKRETQKMKTVGELLKSARLKKGLTVEQIAAYTKINKKYLEAIELNSFQDLPPAAFAKGFLHTYAALVEVNPETVLAIFRRDFDQDDRGRIIPRSLTDPVKPARPVITPTLITWATSIILGLVIIGFFVRQIVLFSATPPLSLAEPTANAVLISPVTVRGQTEAQASVTVNNRPIVVNPGGDFSAQIQLTPGQHTLVVVTTNRSGKKTSLEQVIYVQPTPDGQ